MYSLFMAVSAKLLKQNGQLIFITPRSFTAGLYFRLFRERFFTLMRPEYIHSFISRTKAFNKDAVLQENIILKAVRESEWTNVRRSVTIAHSEGADDLQKCDKLTIGLDRIIDMNSKSKTLRIPISEKEERIVELMNSWQGTLHSYGLQISTGPVVPFRALDFIDDSGNVHETHVPLLWMQNVRSMSVQWPVQTKKQQYIKLNKDSIKLLVKDKNYIILRRFSPKEEHRRLQAAPYRSGILGSDYIGLENHLNYIYKPQGELSLDEAYGLSAILNCEIFDIYFRTLNGNTEVSATEIREVPLPPIDTIKYIGSHIIKQLISNKDLDEWVSSILTSITN